MNIKDARTIDAAALYERRKQAVMLFKKGMKRHEIAPIVGVHRLTVGIWIRDWEEGGLIALKANSSGRPKGTGRKLSPDEEAETRRALVDKCPDQLKLPFALWTRNAVREFIRQRFNVKMSLQAVGDYLKLWGFTPQKAIRRAYERNEKKVREWKTEEYPLLVKKAKLEKAEIHWGDETGIRSDDVNARGYAPTGKTPIQRVKGTPEKVNMISSVSNQGQLRFMFYKETMNAALLIKFMKRLTHSVGRKVILILDNLRVHHSKVLKVWLEANKNLIEIYYLPSYSPDLNPDEFMNSDLKSHLNKQPDARAKGKLEKSAFAHMKSVQKRPQHIKNLFQAESVRYAS
jgi:transposase